ncbi:hypothetical protein [Paraburkholderia unamae]|uniref:Uncharacterized protein n=1 Tax=Paraburkholderia unamae TaxID=219649 RepID=A0ACC6RHQ1_9BURK
MQLSTRDDNLLGLRLEGRALQERTQALESTCTRLRARLTATETATADAAQRHERELAAERARYDGLAKQLLRETAHQRETFQTERQRLEAELARAAERLAALESLREYLLTELSDEHNARQQAAAEATALATLVEQQRQTLALVGAATGKKLAAGARRPARTAAPTARTTTVAAGTSRRKAR